MPTITKKQLTEYNKMVEDEIYGRRLTPVGLAMICNACDNDPKKIGLHMLETVHKFRQQGIIS